MEREIHAWSTVGLAITLLAVDPQLAGGCWMGIVLHPDLDMSDTPYGKFRKHRGLSHWPIIGTLDRILWFCWPLALLDVDWTLIVAGLILSDLLHIGLDVLDNVLRKRGMNL